MGTSYRVLSAGELDAGLIGAWQPIQRANARFASPYFHPDFTVALARVRPDVRVAVIENDRRAVGFFPHQRGAFGRGRPAGGPLSDYHGVIVKSGAQWALPELLRAAGLAMWNFNHLVDDSGRFAPYVRARAFSPQIDLSGGFEKYLRCLGAPPQDFLRKARKLAREVGPLRLNLHDEAALEQLFAWKSAQYRRTGAPDVFAVGWTVRLVRELMALQGAEFSGVCSALYAGERLVAVHAGMRAGAVLHWWFPAYDPELARCSPGMILLMRLAEALHERGVRTIDLGKGDEPYKKSLMTGAAQLAEGAVVLPSLVSTASAFATNLLPLKVIRRIERARRFA